MKTSTVTPEIAQFAEGVRAALADLPADEVEDLTEGLEADLAESLAEDLRRTLPDPVAYAAELRLAAGLPGPQPASARGALAGLLAGWRGMRADIAVVMGRNPAVSAVVDFVVTLRPFWWVVRAWVATWLLSAFFGMESGYWFEGVWWFVLVALTVVSVQWGRGRWHFPGLRPVLLVGNVLAVVALVAVIDAITSRPPATVYVDSGATVEQQDPTGVFLNGVPVTNIFGFDAKGRALKDIQLFDQDGNPLATAVAGANGCLDPDCQETGLWVPSTLRNGTVAWNVFPMRMVKDAVDANGGLKVAPGAEPKDRVPPFKGVPALVSPEKVAKPNG